MTLEQRLVAALRSSDFVVPSPDLWSRVLHSIEEDRTHRRRVIHSVLSTLAAAAVLIGVGVLALRDVEGGRQVLPAAMAAIEFLALVVLIAVLGRGIRRFGRGYATDLWRVTPTLAASLLRLLDIAYFLVFGGYVLLTMDFDGDATLVADQLEHVMTRLGGLVLIMGLLHAATMMALPMVALVSNSTRVGKALPRWVLILLALVGLGLGGLLLNAFVSVAVGLS